MSVLELPVAADEPQATNDAEGARVPAVAWRPLVSVELLAYVAIGLLAILVHLWGLGDRAMHHDETLHASYSWYIYVGRGYIHDPLLHGPFLYHFGALLYLLFGDSDTTARLGMAIFGTALTLTPALLRRELGRSGALLAALYLLLSPSVLYMGRMLRHDMYSLLFELLVVVGLVRYLSTRRPGWLYLAAAAFGLMFTNQETSYLFALLWGGLLVLALLWRVWKPGIALLALLAVALAALVFVLPGEAQVDGERNATRDPQTGQLLVATPGPLLGWGPLETADNGFALRIRNRADNDGGRSLAENALLYFSELGTFFRHPAILLALALVTSMLGLLYWLIWRRAGRDGLTPWQRARRDHNDAVLEAFASLADNRRVAIALGIFFGIYTLFFTAFFFNLLGVVTGTTGSLLYWLAQHEVKRGGQPGHYYLVLLSIYEPLLLVWFFGALAVIGRMVWVRVRGSGFRVPGSGFRVREAERDDEQGNGVEEDTTGSSAVAPDILAPDSRTLTPDPLLLPIMLLWWAITALALYSWAGEKMPWLVIHMALPLTLLGAWACDRAVRWGLWGIGFRVQGSGFGSSQFWDAGSYYGNADNHGNAPNEPKNVALPTPEPYTPNPIPRTLYPIPRTPLALFIGTFAVICVLGFSLMSVAVRQASSSVLAGPLVVLVITLLLMLLLFAAAGLRYGWRWGLGALALAGSLLLGVYTLRSAYTLSFVNGDTPREMMIYTQTSPDVARVVRRLERAALARTNGLDMPVIYDNETVWSWYMRNFRRASQTGPALATAPDPEVQAVVLLQENLDTYPQNRERLAGFRIQRLPLRWWLPEDELYRLPPGWRSRPLEQNSLLGRLLRAPLDSTTITDVWQYLIYRDPGAPLGSSDFVLAVRPDLADEIGLGTGAEQ